MKRIPKESRNSAPALSQNLCREVLPFIFEDIARSCSLSLAPRQYPNFVDVHGLAARDVCINSKTLQLITILKQNNNNPHQPLMRNSGKSTELGIRKSNFWRRFATN